MQPGEVLNPDFPLASCEGAEGDSVRGAAAVEGMENLGLKEAIRLDRVARWCKHGRRGALVLVALCHPLRLDAQSQPEQ